MELEAEELAAAKYPQFRTVPLTGPLLAVADIPTDPAERKKVVEAAMAGRDMQNFPRYFVPYEDRSKEVLAKADTIAKLRTSEPVSAKAVDAYLASAGIREDSVRALMLRTRFAWIVVLVDPNTAKPVKMLLGEQIVE